MATTFGGITIPLIYHQEVTRELMADEQRTAGGKLRMDIVAFKRIWSLETRPMTTTERDNIINYLDSIYYGVAPFHLDEFGVGVFVDAYMRVESEGRDVDNLPGRRSLVLTVIEE
jgi:hypothetical protein